MSHVPAGMGVSEQLILMKLRVFGEICSIASTSVSTASQCIKPDYLHRVMQAEEA
uniref:AlNc14C4G584 protein n=1 Tax=Albugo laibachii Nc14 TaxID=890382 RepID=F0W0E1_9STRA|nr:AlNc14C4G584 [Albugo laibachii Nc14]|eukprot:CCA14513.1 AlNc14C4G584 [Albugo laibachii Nc14]